MTYPHIWLAFASTLMGLEKLMKYLPCEMLRCLKESLSYWYCWTSWQSFCDEKFIEIIFMLKVLAFQILSFNTLFSWIIFQRILAIFDRYLNSCFTHYFSIYHLGQVQERGETQQQQQLYQMGLILVSQPTVTVEGWSKWINNFSDHIVRFGRPVHQILSSYTAGPVGNGKSN